MPLNRSTFSAQRLGMRLARKFQGKKLQKYVQIAMFYLSKYVW